MALTRALSIEQHVGAARDVDSEQENQQHGGDQLDEHARAVDPGHQLHTQGVDDGGEDDQHRGQEHGVDGVVVFAGPVADELKRRRDLGQRVLVGEGHRCERHDRRREHHPAAQPRDGRGPHALGPVVDRPGHREVGGQLGEGQRHHQLAHEDHRPGPPVGRSAEREAEEEQLEDAGENRDVADPRREAGELPDAAVELLLVAELGELVGVGVSPRRRHRRPPLWA